MAKVIGIDLGTTNSCVAVMEAGQPKVLENKEGRRTTPSVVAINQKSGERFVGELARRQSITNPENTIFSAKRFIGRRSDDPSVQDDAKRVPFKVVRRDNGDAGIMFGGKVLAPAEISAMVLRKLKEDAESKLGEEVTQAVITVPAYFNDSQREATKVAGKIAGLEVLRIINEPTAAALAYGFDKKKGDETIVVYDLGGGTFDVTVLQLGEGVFEVKSTNGDTHLGGDDFDARIVTWIADDFKAETGIDLRKDPSAHQRLRVEAERAKIELSTVTQTEINLPFISADTTGPKHLQKTLTRAKLEQLTGDLIERTAKPCLQALKDAGIAKEQINEVVMVGGMTRMPAVVAKAAQIFGKEPNQSINPDEVVAIGAAIQGGVLRGEVKDILLLDVTPLTLGLETLGGVMTPLIKRNTTIPTEKTETFTTAAENQTTVEIHVIQGERQMAVDSVSIGRFTLDGILPAPRGVPQIEVKFAIDADGILTVTATDKAAKKEQHITITGRSGLSKNEVERLVREAETHAEEDKQKREAIETRNSAESAINQAERLVRENADKVPVGLKEDIEAKIKSIRDLLASGSSDTAGLATAVGALQVALQKIGEAVYASAASAGAPGQSTGQTGGHGEGKKPDDTVEGEFREVN